jgi:spermidine/putrescine transport system permease protein
MSKIGRPLLEAAEDLGCNGFQKLRKVIMPLSLSGVISGIIMVFVPSISTFFISQKMSDNKIMLIGDIIEQQIKELWADRGLNKGAAMSLVLMAIILLCTFVMNRFGDEDDEGGIVI